MLSLNTNLSALNAHSALERNEKATSSSAEKLSSGLRINHAADDATGLEVANMLLTQVNGSQQASSNAQDAIGLLNTTDGALGSIGDSLQQLRSLAVQASDGTLSASDRANADAEAQQLIQGIDDTSQNTSFNGAQPLNSAASTFTFQVGANNGQTISTTINGTSSGGLGLTGLSLATQGGAQNAISSIDTALSQIDTQRGSVGATTNQLSAQIDNLGVYAQNSSQAESNIRDTDYASEMTAYSSAQIMSSASLALFAQANSTPKALLSLFG